ncbi:MAG: AAA family ATPase, partial [Desulfuromonadales bacterium C00003107]
MLIQPLLDKLTQLRLPGIRSGLEEQLQNPQYAELSFEDRLGLLVDLECTRRADNSLHRRIKTARFTLPATIEDLDLSPARGLDRGLILELAQGEWIRRHLNILVLGPTGAGKSYMACALGHAACRQGFSVRYQRTSRLLHEIMLSHADGSYPKLLTKLARVQLLIFDDWLRDPLTPSQARDLLEILDDRYGQSST